MNKRYRLTVAVFSVCLGAVGSASAQPLHQQIDKLIDARADGKLADNSFDAEFARRIWLDLAGTIPSAQDVARFLADNDAEKRTKLIDRLLASDDYPRRMQQALTVMLLERRTGTAISDEEWNTFLQEAFRANKPWNEFVRELVAVDGRDVKTRPALRFFVDGGRNSHHQMTQDVARLFLGMNIMCAQCHDHPSVDDYKQADYFGLFAFLSQSKMQNDSKLKKPFLIETVASKKTAFQSVFTPEDKKQIGPRLPGNQEIEIPTFEKGQEFAKPASDGLPGVPKFRPRQLLSDQLSSAQNERFVRNSVNRFWFVMMGRGLVNPLDLLHPANPPSHPELLDALAREFVTHKFDVKWLLREIALSKTYQRSSLLPVGVAAADVKPAQHRVAILKPLSAEQLTWSILTATGHLNEILKAPNSDKKDFLYNNYINGRIDRLPRNLSEVLELFTATFGSPPGESEDQFAPSMGQSLFLMNEKLVLHWLQPRGENLTARLSRITDNAQLAEQLYLSVLSRLPVAEESAELATFLNANSANRAAAIGQYAWALLAGAEFRLNH
ncbi:MAG: DUF1553 domain-containing protein [Planctomycetota bacterium]|nr:DUF1553 domain-containing protein [Planctomycetota bacterium]